MRDVKAMSERDLAEYQSVPNSREVREVSEQAPGHGHLFGPGKRT